MGKGFSQFFFLGVVIIIILVLLVSFRIISTYYLTLKQDEEYTLKEVVLMLNNRFLFCSKDLKIEREVLTCNSTQLSYMIDCSDNCSYIEVMNTPRNNVDWNKVKDEIREKYANRS